MFMFIFIVGGVKVGLIHAHSLASAFALDAASTNLHSAHAASQDVQIRMTHVPEAQVSC